ncbi:MAG: hypothetical protein ACN4G0_10290 [Polyangiales bacterium]
MRYTLMPSAQAAPHFGVLLSVLLALLVVAPLLPSERAGAGAELFFDCRCTGGDSSPDRGG